MDELNQIPEEKREADELQTQESTSETDSQQDTPAINESAVEDDQALLSEELDEQKNAEDENTTNLIQPAMEQRQPVIQKGKKKKLIVALGILFVVAVLIFGVVFCILNLQKKQGESIMSSLQDNDVNKAYDLYSEASETVRKRYYDEIQDEFNSMVFDNKYSFGSSSTGLVLEDQLNDYSDYLHFSEMAGYSENNKAVRYLKTALKLKEYVKYNNIILLFLRISDDYENFLYYVKAAMNATNLSGTTLLAYHNKGKECIASIYNEAKNYSGYLCLDLKSAAHELYMWFDTNGSAVSAQDFIDDRDQIAEIISETADAVSEINSIKKAMEAY